MVMAGRSVHLTTVFFLGKLEQVVNQYFVHILSLVTILNDSAEGRRMIYERMIYVDHYESMGPRQDLVSCLL